MSKTKFSSFSFPKICLKKLFIFCVHILINISSILKYHFTFSLFVIIDTYFIHRLYYCFNTYLLTYIIVLLRLKKIQDKKKIANKKKELLKQEMKEAEYGNMLDEGDEDLLF